MLNSSIIIHNKELISLKLKFNLNYEILYSNPYFFFVLYVCVNILWRSYLYEVPVFHNYKILILL